MRKKERARTDSREARERYRGSTGKAQYWEAREGTGEAQGANGMLMKEAAVNCLECCFENVSWLCVCAYAARESHRKGEDDVCLLFRAPVLDSRQRPLPI